MADDAVRCDACGQEIQATPFDPYRIPVTINPNPDEPKNFVERSLKEHNQLLEKLSGQLDELLELMRSDVNGESTGESKADAEGQALDLLDLLRQHMRPRHGLCIDGRCAPCRVHEEAIKEHVLLYIDWKVPGTVEKLQQTRHRN